MSKKHFYMSTVAGFAAFLAADSASALTISAYLRNPIGGGLPHLSTFDPTFGQPGYSGSMASLTDITAGNYPTGLQFAKFNTSLGTLTGIAVQLYIDYNSLLSIVNSSLDESNGDAATRITAKATFASGTVASSIYLMPSYTYSAAAGGTVGATLFSTGDANLNGGNGGPVSLLRNLSNATDKVAYQAYGANNVDL
ncbi:MAG: choice-of-anchor E domain-containing protein, partial [Acetobacteraceae bacterium]|nr:choice-of-anchor E domain-containing protein [Acetobacteraceae bacterium]